MTRNLKALIATALALTAFGAFSASGAQAADEFHCSVSPCKLTAKQDGTGATAHQVFIVENAAKTESVSFTCHALSADAEFSGNTTTELTLTNLQYTTCTVNGAPGVTWDMNNCHYTLTRGSAGNAAAGTTDGAETHLDCPGLNKVRITIPEIGCTFEIGSQVLTGVGYHTVGTSPNREITVTTKNATVAGVTGNAACNPLMNTGQAMTGTWTTGNMVLTGEDAEGEMADAWFSPSPPPPGSDEFHCSVTPCKLTAKQDGTGSTAHQVFIIENASKTESLSFTCHAVTAEAEFSGGTTLQVVASNVQYGTCTGAFGALAIDMNGCGYRFTAGAPGNAAAGTTDAAQVHVECPAGKKIQMTIAEIGCTFEIGPQTLTGIGYHTVGTVPNREGTVTAKNVGGIVVTGSEGCNSLIKTSQTLIGTYTTGNAIATGETPVQGIMADAWFA
jgi:hypothetical protein